MTEYSQFCRNLLITKGKRRRVYERIMRFLQHGPGNATPISELTAEPGGISRTVTCRKTTQNKPMKEG